MKHPLNSPLGRMGVETLEDSPQRCMASIPVGRMLNPLTGIPTLATTAMLVDQVGGLLNHRRHGPDEWAMSSELSLQLTPDAAALIAAAPDVPVLATGRAFGTKNASALGLCELTVGDQVVATGSVRSFYITAPDDSPTEWAIGPTDAEPPESLAERMAIRVAENGGASKILIQTRDPAVNNTMSIVHGGLAATALELVASAAVNHGRADMPLNTASLQVNYLRPFRAGPKSRYVGTALRVGRGSGVSEAQAIGDDGVVALIARLTAYR
jgi:uncharacterized protein (TIGR00369 family)